MLKMNKKMTVCMPAWSGESEILPLTLGAAMRAWPEASFTILDDRDNPLPKHVRKALPSPVRYKQTSFDRQRNLNGIDCVRGLVTEYLEAAELDGNNDGFIVKLDPDTIVLRGEHLQEHMEAGAEMYASTTERGLFSGACYAASVAVMKRVQKAVQTDGVLSTERNYVPEDCTIMGLVYALCCGGKYVFIWTRQFPEAQRYFGAFDVRTIQTDKYQEHVDMVASECRIVTLGNTGLQHLPKAWQVIMANDLLEARKRYPSEVRKLQTLTENATIN